MQKSAAVSCALVALLLGSGARAATRVEAGALVLDVNIARTPHLFHVVDQLSAWSRFCHGQYGRGFGPLTDADRTVLAEHVEIRLSRGWGGGLEQAFYTPLALDDALAAGIAAGHLTEAEAVIERRVLLHFADRVDRLIETEEARLNAFVERIEQRTGEIELLADQLARLFDTRPAPVPVYILANPADHDFGGGFNGGRLTIEIPRKRSAFSTFLHEITHAFIDVRRPALERAVDGVAGLDLQTLNEGIAHAVSPGILHDEPKDADPLARRARKTIERGQTIADYEGRVYRYALALRPLVRETLNDPDTELEAMLGRAVDVWRAMAALEEVWSPLPPGEG